MRKKNKILLAEDEALIALAMKLQLMEAGYDVYKTVASGEEAIACVENEPPDVVLMDIQLAGKVNGIEAARQITDAHDIPIIFITGYPDLETKEKAISLKPKGYFVKPVGTDIILSALENN